MSLRHPGLIPPWVKERCRPLSNSSAMRSAQGHRASARTALHPPLREMRTRPRVPVRWLSTYPLKVRIRQGVIGPSSSEILFDPGQIPIWLTPGINADKMPIAHLGAKFAPIDVAFKRLHLSLPPGPLSGCRNPTPAGLAVVLDVVIAVSSERSLRHIQAGVQFHDGRKSRDASGGPLSMMLQE